MNDLSLQIPVEETLVTAESIYHQLAATQDKLPSHICDILGFNPYGSRSESPLPQHNTPRSAPETTPAGTVGDEQNERDVSPGNMTDSTTLVEMEVL